MTPIDQIKANLKSTSNIHQMVTTNIDHYINHVIYNKDMTMNDETVSIVMTTHKRAKQTLFTLDTINNSLCKNIQVIIVDDSDNNEFIADENLQQYPFRIDYIKIKPETRNWINPCVNYNIGFSFVLGSYIIIQNAEVCHVGDVVSFVKNNCKESTYMVFDVASTESYANNDQLYTLGKNFNYGFIANLFGNGYRWYQHSVHRPANFHFLVAIHINDFNKLGNGFDFDFALGRWYDDDEFVYRIKYLLKLSIKNVISSQHYIMGIHQHHDKVMLTSNDFEYKKSIELNKFLMQCKKNYFEKYNKWLYLYDVPDPINNYYLLFSGK